MALRWEDERYVRLYTKDTATWKLLPWQSKCLLPLLLRKLDRAGLASLGEEGDDPMEGAAALTDLPIDLVREGLPPLLSRNVFALQGMTLIAPNFLAAQEAVATNAARQRAYRERARDVAAAGALHDVTEGNDTVTNRYETVTDGNAPSHSVTPSLAVLSLTVPSLATKSDVGGGDPASVQVLAALNAARKRVIPGARSIRSADSSLRYIADRLREGYSLEDCEHVIAVCEAEVRADDGAAKWFDAVTPFRPDNFARKLGRTPKPAGAKPTKPQRLDILAHLRTEEESDA